MSLKNKIYYIHIPKTAGTVLNSFLQSEVESTKAIEHIESKKEILQEGNLSEKYDFVSGHIGYDVIQKSLEGFKTVTTMREPITQVMSHLTYVKELGFNKKRYMNHPQMIRNIIDKMHTVDFSNPDELDEMITWLETKKYFLFHNVLTVYMTKQPLDRPVDDTDLAQALLNIKCIDYVGIQERLDEFMLMLSYRFGISLDNIRNKKMNVTSNRYGLDITNVKTLKVLERLTHLDKILYDKATSLFLDQFYDFLKDADRLNQQEYTKRYCLILQSASETNEFKGTAPFQRSVMRYLSKLVTSLDRKNA